MIKLKSYRTTKKKLLKKCAPMGEREFRRLINPIIAKARNLALLEASQKQFLQTNEVLLFMEKIGMDKDEFGKTIIIPGNGLKKERLRTLLPHVPYEDFTPVLIKILSQTRKNTLHQGRYSKYINKKEVLSYLNAIGENVTDPNKKTSDIEV